MEVNDKIAELEDELKLLKAEIRNVLLDIREVVLERKNPLGEEHESAFIRMDLNTTARAMAAEAAAHEAAKAGEDSDPQAESDEHASNEDEPAAAEAPEDADVPGDLELDPTPEPSVGDVPAEPAPEPAPEPETAEPAPEPVQVKAATAVREEVPMETVDNTEIPQMFMADLAPLSGNGSLAEWVTQAIDNVGVEDLRRVITMFRLWGNVPPNISRALAHLQELLASTDEPRPAWLKVLQDLDRLASL